MYYICIPNRSKIRSFAKKRKTDGNFAKYGVQSQTTDSHIVRAAKAFLRKKKRDVLAQKSSLRTANKASLQCKQALFDAQMHHNCQAKKASSHCKQGFFGDKVSFFQPQIALIHAFAPRRNSWNGNSRCQNFLLHTQYLHILGGRASPPDNTARVFPLTKVWVLLSGGDARPPTTALFPPACPALSSFALPHVEERARLSFADCFGQYRQKRPLYFGFLPKIRNFVALKTIQ